MNLDEQPPSDDPVELSRRSLIGGLAAAAGAAGLVTMATGKIAVAAPDAPILEALAPTVAGLVYLPLDAFAFDVVSVTGTPRRLYQEVTGMQPEPSSDYIYASLPIPIGSMIKQINVAYQGQPIISITRRTFGSTFTEIVPGTSLTAGGGAKTQSLAVTAELTSGASYAVRAFCSAGDSILGMTIGYIPAAQAFIPYTGTTDPRILDTRPGSKFAANEERVIDLSSLLIGSARAAVFNLTATETAGSGFLSAYRDGIGWPNNSSVNFTGSGQTIANGVVCTMTAGKIKIRCGPAASHVLIDVIGSLL
jgi:hypothetical protein